MRERSKAAPVKMKGLRYGLLCQNEHCMTGGQRTLLSSPTPVAGQYCTVCKAIVALDILCTRGGVTGADPRRYYDDEGLATGGY